MDQTIFEPQPIRSKNPMRFFAAAAVLFIGITAVAAAVILPGMKTTDDRSKATNTASCAGSVTDPAASCFEKCNTNDDCATGLQCLSAGTVADNRCRNPQNPTSTTCVGPTTAPTRPPSSAFPSAPPGCVYQQVECFAAPCNPILVCPSGAPSPLPSAPPGCTYKQVECFQAPCPPILECPSGTPTSAPTTSHVVKFTFRSSAGGQNMAIDYIKDGDTVVDDKSSLISYTGTWTKGADSTPLGGTYAATSTNGSSMSYVTTSSAIIVRPYRYPTRGILDVYVDGVLTRSITDLATGSGWTDIAIKVSTAGIKTVTQ